MGSFRAAGRTLLSLGLGKCTEGNLSVYDGATLAIPRTGSGLARLVAGWLAVRGLPVLGMTSAYGLSLWAERSGARSSAGVVRELERAGRTLVSSRPTAANIGWAVRRVLAAARAEAVAAPPGARGADLT